LNAISEQHRIQFDVQEQPFCELKLGTVSPSTINKYRRQSISSTATTTTTRHARAQKSSCAEPSVTWLLGRALDEEQKATTDLPWNDGLDDLIDIVLGWDVQLSVGDAELNAFRMFLQFHEYAQPSFYQSQLDGFEALQSFCHGGGDELQCRGGANNQLVAKVNINEKCSAHPQIVFNVAYSQECLSNRSRSTLDID